MRELREDTFSGNKNNDAQEHVERILDIVSLFNIPGVTHDAVMLRVFLITRAAKRWVDRLPPGTINTWDLLKKAFIQKYCPPSKTAKQGLIPNKTPAHALEAIQTMADHSHNWHDGSTSRKVSNGSSNESAAITSKLDGLERDMKKLKENVHVIQVGCKTCRGAHLNKECLLYEEVKSVEEIEQLAKDCQAKAANEVPNSSIGQCKVIFANIKAPTDETYSNGVSFISDDNVEVFKEIKEGPLGVLPCQLPPKELSPGSFTLLFTIVSLNIYAMEYVGSSVNIMTRSMFNHLKLTNLKKTSILVEMANMMKKPL
ncbi:hypothetical protein Tco_1126262 [Tanacetum coccineum]